LVLLLKTNPQDCTRFYYVESLSSILVDKLIDYLENFTKAMGRKDRNSNIPNRRQGNTNRTSAGKRQKWLGKKDKRVGGVAGEDSKTTVDFKRDVLKALLPIAAVVTFFAALFLLLLWLVQNA
jgi:hypothetical protein